MEFIRDFLWLWVFGAFGGTGYILWALFIRGAPVAARTQPAQQQITTRRTASPPVARPAGAAPPMRTPVPSAGSPPGSPEYQRRGSAPTVKLPTSDPARAAAPTPAKSADDDAAADLFSGVAKPASTPAPPRPPSKDNFDKAGRIEEYGFHVGSKASSESGSRTATAPTPAVAMPVVQAPVPPATPAVVPGQGRSQTQELDDILKRIDAVLSETANPAAEATMANPQPQNSSGEQTLPAPTPPPAVDKSRSATDPNQQKLF